ncbi:hypothetical protein ISCGN_029698 [Ixodes scapularis]
MGSALQTLVDNKKAQGEVLGRKGRLTQERIKKITNYYGYALWSHNHDVPAMQKAGQATLHHMSSTDESPDHGGCRELGEALKTNEADPIEVTQTEDHEYCMTSTLRRPPTVKGDVPTRRHGILTMFNSLLENHRALGVLVFYRAPKINLLDSRCSCNHCVVIDNGTEAECICCHDMGLVLTRVQPAGCITEHPEFSMLCPSNPVLRLLYFELRDILCMRTTTEECQMSLQFQFHRAHNTVSTIVADVCPAIYSALKDDFLKVCKKRIRDLATYTPVPDPDLLILEERLVSGE